MHKSTIKKQPLTAAQRSARTKARKLKEGYVRRGYWVKKDRTEEAKAAIDKVNEGES